MLKRKSTKWFEVTSSAHIPLNLKELASGSNYKKLISFIEEKIKTNKLKGYLTVDERRYVPLIFIQKEIRKYLRNDGFVDICNLIDSSDLPGAILEQVIHDSVQEIDGFFDIVKRRFFTKGGAVSFFLNILGNRTSIDLRYLLNQIYWTEDQVEAVLNLLASKGLYTGYIDPINHRIVNFNNLSFSRERINKKSIKTLAKFIQVGFQISSEVSLRDVSGLTKLNHHETMELLAGYRENWSFAKSSDGTLIFPITEIVTKIILDLHVYQNVPLEFWVSRLDVDPEDLNKILLILNSEFRGTLSPDEFKVPSIQNFFKSGVNIEGFAQKLFLTPKQILTCFKDIFNKLNLRMIAGDTTNPFLAKGTEDFMIFCQIDTSSYINPSVYFECQNCRRIMCSNCRNIDSTHECPFCGNIAAFIVDLPRFCADCGITYTYSYNLETTEECYFCKTGPLKQGWAQIRKRTDSFSALEQVLKRIILSSDKSEIFLTELVERVSKPFDKVVKALENLIIHQEINAQIEIRDLKILMKISKSHERCVICTVKLEDNLNYQCISCNSFVCDNCYSEMELVRMISCPECGSKLVERY